MFLNRTQAGEQLAERLKEIGFKGDWLVLALPRGGVPVAAPLARHFGWPLDLMMVGKLSTLSQRELAFGAITADGTCVFNEDIVRLLALTPAAIEEIAESKLKALKAQAKRLGSATGCPPLRGRRVLLVDDGLATGATMRVAVRSAKQQGAAEVVVAVPVGSEDACRALGALADQVVCCVQPQPFYSVGTWYQDFTQVEDTEVVALMQCQSRPQK